MVLVRFESRSREDLSACISDDSGLLRIWNLHLCTLAAGGSLTGHSQEETEVTSIIHPDKHEGLKWRQPGRGFPSTDLCGPVILRTGVRVVSHSTEY